MRWLLCLLLSGALAGRASGTADWQSDPVLSPLMIQHMVTDAAGFRWVATDMGVYRYDGNELVPLKNLVRQGPRPRVELVGHLALDAAGRLWLGADDGLWRFDPATGHLLAVPLPLRPTEGPGVRALRHDPRTDRLWVSYGERALAVVAAARPQAPLFPVLRVAEYTFDITLDAGADGVWLAGDTLALYHLAPNGRVRRRVPLAEQLRPIPGTRPQRFFGRTGLFVLDSAHRLRPLRRWPRLPRSTSALS